ncbi:hypothetical protein ACFPN2_34295 [Steroidobacter flavus]|uniref:Cyclic nucleotide-binding domain-containing protein n=1 Tax=Steroidobacter flavus TaxID=1842136 RepID=A0ABV8T419_9GAMM
MKGNFPGSALIRQGGSLVLLILVAVLVLGGVFGTIATGNVGCGPRSGS